MKSLFILSFLTLMASCSSTGNYVRKIASDEEIKKDSYRVGEIKISLLKPDQFRSLYGTAWVLMDGSSQEGTLFAQTTGMNKVPDARGAFLRMQNNGRTDNFKNPEEKQLGEAQSDEFKVHSHTYTDSGGSSHIRYNAAGGWEGNANASTGDRGGNETRPKNITVNYFIKVANCAAEEMNCL